MTEDVKAAPNKKKKLRSKKGKKTVPVKKETNEIKHVSLTKKKNHTTKSNKNIKRKNANSSLTKKKSSSNNEKCMLQIGTLLPINTMKVISIDVNNKQINVSIHIPNENINDSNNEENKVLIYNGRILFNQIDDDDYYYNYNFNKIIDSNNKNCKKDNLEELFPINKYIQKDGVIVHTTTIPEEDKHIISISLRDVLVSKIQRSKDIQKHVQSNENSSSSNAAVFSLNIGTILPKNSLTITKVVKYKMYVSFSSAYSDKKHKGRIDMRQITDDVNWNKNIEDLKPEYKEGQILPSQGIILFCNNRKKEEEYRISLRPSFVFTMKYNVPGYLPYDYNDVNIGDVVVGYIIQQNDNHSTKVHFGSNVTGLIVAQHNKEARALPLYHAVCCQVIELDVEKRKINLKFIDV